MLDHGPDTARAAIRDAHLRPEAAALDALAAGSRIDADLRGRIHARASDLVRRIREETKPSMMELFLGEYGLSTDEGVALMCLAEALLRVPDAATIDDLIEDKIAPSEWGAHLGRSHSQLVNASTWALYLTGNVLRERAGSSVATTLRGAVKRLGEPVIRQAVGRAMREMGRQFVLGETIEAAMARARRQEARGYTYSYDMLGEAARTEADARRYHAAYADAIAELAKAAARLPGACMRDRPGISIKLSALHPRYETLQRDRVMAELLPRAQDLARRARVAGIGLNIDAEEAARLDLSLDVIEALLSDPQLAGWDGFGVVVQAYGTRAGPVIDWLHALAGRAERRIMVRLVKGAYWDTEIKLAQAEGLQGFPVFTRKAATDASFLWCAEKLLGMTDRIYPQFATHNAHTVAAILEMAGNEDGFEFQRLHGMGEALHDTVLERHRTRCRIYAPVGAHRDLLAYLVRRLLENGANSSFVNQLVDPDVAPEEVAADPFAALDGPPRVSLPSEIFAPRVNSRGWDLGEPAVVQALLADVAGAKSVPDFAAEFFQNSGTASGDVLDSRNPATGTRLARVPAASAEAAASAIAAAVPWAAPVVDRAAALRRAADLFEADHAMLFALCRNEAGKTLPDAVAELREAVDFLRYYADEAEASGAAGGGVWTCISPWNFPLAIFTGQVAAALAAGNAVLAKPAEATPLIAARAVQHLHAAGVPAAALRLLPGSGAVAGAALCADPRIDGVAFTGSLATAQAIHRVMADHLDPGAPLIAETGGLNGMIVDSTALPEQAVRDIVASAFRSAGQRCSALRVLYLQEDVADTVLAMLFGAMDALVVGDPADPATDVGPVIDAQAQAVIEAHVADQAARGRLLKQVAAPSGGSFVGPAVIEVDGISALEEEIFGPILHVATYRSEEIDAVIAAINARGYGLTFGMHSRIDDRVQHVVDRVRVGNLYVNRDQIGAIVGSQPFGGEGLSGTGPKAGGPRYVPRFIARERPVDAPGTGNPAAHSRPDPDPDPDAAPASARDAAPDLIPETILAAALDAPAPDRPVEVHDLPGPTGESNRLGLWPMRHVLCLGPGAAAAEDQLAQCHALGVAAIAVAPGLPPGQGRFDGRVAPEALAALPHLEAVVYWGDMTAARPLRQALARRGGGIARLLTERDVARWLLHERHVCIDTTAAGGNAALLAG